jgi:hypothetical protein
VTKPETGHLGAGTHAAGQRCELMWECTGKCHPPTRCDKPAVERVTTLCSDGCGRARAVWLCCARCGDVIAAQQTVPPVRRPL